MNFLNLTGHSITIVRENQPDIEIPASGYEARINTNALAFVAREIHGMPVITNYVGRTILTDQHEVIEKIMQLLKENKAQYAIVSSFVQSVLRPCGFSRKLLAIDTSPESAIRNEEGQIIGVKRLQRHRQSQYV